MKGFQFFADFGCERDEHNIMRQEKERPEMMVSDAKRLSKYKTNRKALEQYANDGWRMNCFAIYVPDNPRDANPYRWFNGLAVMQEAICAVFGHVNSDVCHSAVSWEYMRTKGKRISESLARKLHPALFAYLKDKNNVRVTRLP